MHYAVKKLGSAEYGNDGLPHQSNKRHGADLGFSLIEVLVALAIASLVSLLVFRSLADQVQHVNRIQNATERAVAFSSHYRLVSGSVEATVPAWPDEIEGRFSGTAHEISGITRQAVFATSPMLQAYSLKLINVEDAQQLSLETAEGAWDIESLPQASKFRFYGHDGLWHDQWPPELGPARGLADLARQAANGPLPAMIVIDEGDNPFSPGWSFVLQEIGGLPARTVDLTGPTDPVF